jgi:integrase
MTLTAKTIEAATCPDDAKQAFIWDSKLKGFGLRTTANGSKAYVVKYRADGRQFRITIGKHPSMRLAEARRVAMVKLSEASTGTNHTAEKTRLKRTWTDQWLDFEQHHLITKSPGYQHSCRTSWRLHLQPILGAKTLASTTHSDVEALRTKLGQRATTNRVLALLSKMASRAITQDYIEKNPVKSVERVKEKPRQRYLTTDEVKRLWLACDGNVAGDAVKMLLLTGARVSELLTARWEHINLDEGIWFKPTTKTGDPVSVAISAPAIDILRARERTSDYVFPGPDKSKPIGSIRKSWLKLSLAAGLINFRLHDLRHSHASILASAGFSLHQIGAQLGHKSQLTTRRYAHLTDARMRAATDAVALNLENNLNRS